MLNLQDVHLTLEALVTVCNGEGALLHGQLVKFGELLKQ